MVHHVQHSKLPVNMVNYCKTAVTTQVAMSSTAIGSYTPLLFDPLLLFPSSSRNVLLQDMVVESVGQGVELPFDWCDIGLMNPGRTWDRSSSCYGNHQKITPLVMDNSPTLYNIASLFQIKILLCNTKIHLMDVPPFWSTLPFPYFLFWCRSPTQPFLKFSYCKCHDRWQHDLPNQYYWSMASNDLINSLTNTTISQAMDNENYSIRLILMN